MQKVLEEFKVEYLQVLDEEGNVDEKLMPKLRAVDIKSMYESMVLTRVFDDKALKLQRSGRMGTYAPTRGQEASQIGSAFCIQKDDIIFPAFRETGVFMVRNTPPDLIFGYWAGDERGMCVPRDANMFPISITVGAHPPHAVGAAMAFNIQKKKAATMVYFGDGATSEGDFHTAMNFAGAFNAPCVFICQNNQWAISLPFSQQTAAKTIAQKAIAYGFPGIRVDGNDVFAVYKVVQEALDRARKGEGPTLIECLTYRMADHTTSDDAKKYRKESEVKEWESKDPILRLKKYMQSKKMFSEDYEKKVLDDATAKIEESVKKMEAWKPQPPEDLFKYLYAEMTPDMETQLADMLKYVPKEGTDTVNKPKEKTSSGNEKGVGVVGELEEAE